MSKKLDDKILLHAKPIVSKEEFINNFKNITLEIKLLRNNKEPIKDISFKAENIKVEKVSNNIELLKKYNLIYENKYIIKYEFTAREIATKLELTDEEIKDVSFVSGWIDANCDGKFSKNYEKWVEIAICRGITKEMLVAMECIEASNNQELIDALNKYCCQHEINTPLRVAHFLAQVAHESGCFSKFKEGDSYQHNAAKSFSKYYKYYKNLENIYGKEKALDYNKFFPNKQKYSKQPDLFNLVYSEENGNGDFESGDGYKYRGRGLIQITGREKYQGFTNEHNRKNPNDNQSFIDNPDLVASSINYAVESACYWWNNLSARGGSVNKYADKGTTKTDVYNVSWCVNSITKQEKPFMPEYNKEANGLKDRWIKFEKIAKHLGIRK